MRGQYTPQPPVSRICEICGKQFMAHVCNVRKGGGRFCSRACMGISFRTPGAKTMRNGYVYVRVDPWPAKPVREHRLVMERELGRPLLPSEDVHHIGLRTDNRPWNLIVLPKGDHTRIHACIPQGKWAKRHDSCTVCGTTARPHYGHGMCVLCYERQRERKR